MIELGATYEDRVTGFRGVAIGHVRYIAGEDRLLLAPAAKDGEMKESQWLEPSRLKKIDVPLIKLRD